MIKQNGGGICWHEVGTGKTMIMCVSAYELKRLGLVQKPLIIGLKAMYTKLPTRSARHTRTPKSYTRARKILHRPTAKKCFPKSRTTTGIALF